MRNPTLVVLAVLFMAPLAKGDEPAPTKPGKRLELISDTTAELKDNQNCPFLRTYKVKYENPEGEETRYIYYTVFQCLDANNNILNQKNYFSSDPNAKGEPLPPSCIPPQPEDKKTEDPCKNGFAVGDVVARTVARTIIPQYVVDDPSNPLAQDPAYKNFILLKEQTMNKPDFTEFTEEQQKVIDAFQEVVKAAANEAIKCFTENVIPVREMDIKFVCAKEGAFTSIEEALKHALGDQITCAHIGCAQLQKDLTHQMATDPNAHVQATTDREDVAPGEPDVFGNVITPVDTQKYVLFSRPAAMSVAAANLVEDKGELIMDTCAADDVGQQFYFIKNGPDTYKIKSATTDLYLTAGPAGANAKVAYRKLDSSAAQIWRIEYFVDSSISITSEATGEVLTLEGGMAKRSASIITMPSVSASVERFLIRKDCVRTIALGRPLLTGNVALPDPAQGYFIRSIGVGKVIGEGEKLDIGHWVAQHDCASGKARQFKLVQNPDRSYVIALAGTNAPNLILAIDQDNRNLILDAPETANPKTWIIRYDDNGVLTITQPGKQGNGLTIANPGDELPIDIAQLKYDSADFWALRKTC